MSCWNPTWTIPQMTLSMPTTIIESAIEHEIAVLREKMNTMHAHGKNVDCESFDLRGKLYGIAADVAPDARHQDLEYMRAWIQPVVGEKSIDIAAGTGFISEPLAHWTGNTVYAIDPSAVQLGVLIERTKNLSIKPVPLSPADPAVIKALGKDIGQIDIATSFGGLHHIVDDHGENMQLRTFQNISKMLKPGGRFIAADVGAGTALARHFETSVKRMCLTSHEEKWLSPERLRTELLEGTDLEFIRAEIIPIAWTFDSVTQLAVFMKALHAYDMSNEAVLADLKNILGYSEKADGKIHLEWPMLFFELRKKTTRTSSIVSKVSCETLALQPDFDNHSNVYELNDPSVGLRGYIALHRIRNGSSIGGTRIYPYARHTDALTDVLRLSRAMSYKCALSGVNLGGGKAVLIADPRIAKTPAFLASYARAISELAGTFYTGEDVGLTQNDVEYMSENCPYFVGKQNAGGDPSEFAAQSTFVAMKAALRATRNSDSFHDIHIAIKGVGKVGSELARLCAAAGARITVADKNESALLRLKKIIPTISIVSSDIIHTIAADIYAPCALGNEFNDATIPLVAAGIICGAANNQLKSPEHGEQLHARNIIYIPDFIANAGGLLNVADELNPIGYSHARVLEHIACIGSIISNIIAASKKTGVPISVIADERAQAIVDV